MLHRFHDLPLRLKIALLAGVPLLALVGLGTSDVLHQHAVHAEAQQFDRLVELTVQSNALTDELQKERGRSAGFIDSGGDGFAAGLAEQRGLVDARLAPYVERVEAVLADADDPAIEARLSEVIEALAGLGTLRAEVTGLRIEVAEQVARYTVLVDALLGVGSVMSRHAPETTLANDAGGLASLAQAKERAGLERALLSSVLSTGRISGPQLDRMNDLIAGQKLYLELFGESANDEQREALTRALSDPSIAEIERMRRTIVSRSGFGGFGIDPEVWFETSSRRIALLAGISQGIAIDLGTDSAAFVATSAARYRTITLVVACAVGLSLLFAALIGRSVLATIGSALTLAQAISRGDLTTGPTTEPHRDEPGRLLEALEGTRQHLQSVIGTAQRVAMAVQQGADAVRDGHEALHARADEQASSIEDTSSSMEEIATTTKNNAAAAESADRLAREARDSAANGQVVVGDAVTAMGEINEASRRIGNIIGVIDEIAFQTNLLALNAAVEAARAGEQGRGFAVVASEVRQLAGRSASAAKEIKDLIQDSVKKVDSGAERVDRSGRTLEELVKSISQVSELITEIATAGREQAIGVERIHGALTRIDGVTQQNLALVQSSSQTSERMDREAKELANQLRFFTVEAIAEAAATAPMRSADAANDDIGGGVDPAQRSDYPSFEPRRAA